MSNSKLLFEVIKTITGLLLCIKSLAYMNRDNVYVTSLGVLIGFLLFLI